MIDPIILDRLCGIAVGAATGDALGMPLEFRPRRPVEALEREMLPGRLPAGSFTDDTEMALALAESLCAFRPLDPADLAERFVAWYQAGPADVGIHTQALLMRIAAGEPWAEAASAAQQERPATAGNGSLMRNWPVALVYWNDREGLIHDSILQSRVTHPHPECVAGCVFTNLILYYLIHGRPPAEAVATALAETEIPEELRAALEKAPQKSRNELPNTGWIRHTLESAVWGLLTTSTFEEAVVQVVNLGNDVDTAGTVVGALAGAAYGLSAIPPRWRETLRGEWPLHSGQIWRARDLIALAERLSGTSSTE